MSENGPTLLVNRGWLPLPANRGSLPEIPTPAGERELNGRLANPPEVGQRLGDPDVLASDVWPQLVTYLDLPVVTAALGGSLEPWIILLDASDPSGFEDRRWTAAVMRPEVHGGYAVQWLGLLLATVVIWIVLGLRRGELLHRKHPTAGEDGRGARRPQ
jgi:surfeit locus 1 family protein